MTRQASIHGITGTINALRYSLARYLRFARPWVDAAAESSAEMIERLAKSHGQHFTRLGELFVERYGQLESRAFPMAFASLNDLSVEYLLPLVIEDEKQIIRIIEATALDFEHDDEASLLLNEVLDCEKRHLRFLERLLVRGPAIDVGSFTEPSQRRTRWRVASDSRRPRIQWERRGARSHDCDNTKLTMPRTSVAEPGYFAAGLKDSSP